MLNRGRITLHIIAFVTGIDHLTLKNHLFNLKGTILEKDRCSLLLLILNIDAPNPYERVPRLLDLDRPLVLFCLHLEHRLVHSLEHIAFQTINDFIKAQVFRIRAKQLMNI